jgi:hypothetical protein
MFFSCRQEEVDLRTLNGGALGLNAESPIGREPSGRPACGCAVVGEIKKKRYVSIIIAPDTKTGGRSAAIVAKDSSPLGLPHPAQNDQNGGVRSRALPRGS